MEYILITFITILITTIIVYKFGNKVLGLQLRFKPLILCAICALLISLVLPRVVVGFAGIIGTLGFLAVFAVVFAYLVARYDNHHERDSAGDTVFSENLGIEHMVAAAAPGEKNGFSLREFLIAEYEGDSNQQDDPQAANFKTISDKNCQLENIVQSDLADVAGDETENSEEEPEQIPAADEPTAIVVLPQELEVHNDASQSCREELTQEAFPSSNSLDDLMDFAFSLKEQEDYDQALNVFRQALKMYPDNSAAPFLVIEIGNILKNKGAYDDAANIFSEGRNLPELKNDHLLEQEFINTIAYLRIVKNSLLQQHFGFIPYSDIPATVLKQIDVEFREWRKLG